MSKIIFFSWQSDIPENKQYLSKILEEFVINNPDYVLEAADRNSDDEDDIAKIIFSKIDQCDFIISDVTLINTLSETSISGRLTSNPNVLYELGYASAKKDIKKIRIANKTYVKKTGDLPFDIRNRKTILRSFTSANRKRVYQEIESVINSKVNIPNNVVRDLLNDVIQCKYYVDNPIIALDISSKDVIARSLSYHTSFVPKKLPKLRRDFNKYPDIVTLVTEYIDHIKKFSEIHSVLGPDGYDRELEALSKINNTLDKLIDYIRKQNIATIRKINLKNDYLESLEAELESLKTTNDLDLKAFYLYCDAEKIYYEQLVWMDFKDEDLKSIANSLQALREKYIEQTDKERIISDISDQLSKRG